MRRGALLAGGLLASLAATALLWALGVPGFFLLLALPFLSVPRWRRDGSPPAPPRSGTCPACGAVREPGHRFCPACGKPLA